MFISRENGVLLGHSPPRWPSFRPSVSSVGDPGIVHRLVGLMVKASASTAEDHGFESPLRRDFSGVESYQ